MCFSCTCTCIQVLSETVSKAIQLTGGPETDETSKFVLMFDRFFDVLNVTNFNNWVRTRKPFQRPYNSGNDERLTVCYMYIMYIII